MNYTTNPLPISAWADSDQPENKMLLQGTGGLSDTELISIILGVNCPFEVARQLINHFGTIREISQAPVSELSRFEGIGKARATRLRASFELGRRRSLMNGAATPFLRRSQEGVNEFRKYFDPSLQYEQFYMLCLNRGNRLICVERISEGGITGTVVDPKKVFIKALEKLATGIILSHNHPSGVTKPSEEDIRITDKIVQAGKFLEIQVLDHLILTETEYFSFSDNGLI